MNVPQLSVEAGRPTRRSFLKSSGVLACSTAAAAAFQEKGLPAKESAERLASAPESAPIVEPERKTPVHAAAEVVVLGGGPAGVAAAVAAARCGADTLLLERYSYLGGMATGGNVINMANFGPPGKVVTKGIPLEYSDRLKKLGAAASETTPKTLAVFWRDKTQCLFHPEYLKLVCNEMLEESGARIVLNCWCVGVAMTDGLLDAVLFESKSGRRAVRGKVFVDCTGDADLAEWTHSPYRTDQYFLGLIMKIGGVDGAAFHDFMRRTGKKEWFRLCDPFGIQADPKLGWAEDIVWMNTHVPGDALSIDDLTRTEIDVRKKLIMTYDHYKRFVPGFEGAFIMDVSPQVNVRESRRILGRHVLSREDIETAREFDDSVGRTINRWKPDEEYTIPYRCLVPRKPGNLLFAGRCISVEHDVHRVTKLIVPSAMTGQAAGTAAAISAASGAPVEDVAIASLQKRLLEQGVAL